MGLSTYEIAVPLFTGIIIGSIFGVIFGLLIL